VIYYYFFFFAESCPLCLERIPDLMYEAHSRLNGELKDYVFESKGHPEPMEEVKNRFFLTKYSQRHLIGSLWARS
jgi:hypothetical protein